MHAVVTVEMPDGQDRRVAATPGSPGTVRRGGRPGLANRVAERVLGPSQVSGIASLSAEEWLRIVPDSTLRVDVCVAAARIKPGKPAAALTVDYAGIAGEEDMQILSQLTQLVALGLEALRSFAEEHLVALTLQRSFLPATLPAIPGVSMAFRYLPASDQAAVGGDFYEALPWRDGVLVVIGDVQGHSLHAATVWASFGTRCARSSARGTRRWRSRAWSTRSCAATTRGSSPPCAWCCSIRPTATSRS